MSENLNEEKMVEAEVVNEEKVEEKKNAEKTSATSVEISVEPTTKSNDFMKKLIPIIKSKAFLIGMAILIYTIIVASITVKIDRKIIANNIEKSFQEAFNIDDIESETKKDVSSKKTEKPSKKVTNIVLNETLTKEDVYEVTVVGFDFGKKIMPPNPPSYYTYYEAKEDGHQYLDLKIDYKNLDATGISADEIASAKIKYAGKYEYTSFSVIEDSDGDFTYSNITNVAPLTVGKMHYLFDVPDEVVDSMESIVATIVVKGDTYEFVIR